MGYTFDLQHKFFMWLNTHENWELSERDFNTYLKFFRDNELLNEDKVKEFLGE